ncbi:hypothetical protein [Streptomyces sp. NBC_00083]|uniref:hypothetical protein n=1 Tax=Streptomyces sp. NBC_00083 TaxID=2975647 RepID=UPI002250F65C|nr:hypothetical protein [Streptomyces sp. NBC_00083]MCX5384691.1 hypothetical protein [Streptomyces sp. NBC_00083]
MTQSNPQPPEHPVGPGDEAAGPTKAARRRGSFTRLTRQGRTRWVALGLVILIGGGVAAAAVAEHHHEERAGGRYASEGPDHRGGPRSEGRGGEKKTREAGQQRWGAATGGLEQAPAPLPALPAAQAVDKATGAVSGGKVESLRVVAQQGGGSAWQAVVLDPQGVRHVVTLAGADGTPTSNTVAQQGPEATR